MRHLLTTGTLATIALAGLASCDRRPQERVVERETTVVHDQPVIVRQDADHHDRQDAGQMGDRRDNPPPDRQDSRH
jgi:hypothetical protein